MFEYTLYPKFVEHASDVLNKMQQKGNDLAAVADAPAADAAAADATAADADADTAVADAAA